MTNLPARPDILDSSISTGVWKTYYGNIRDFISQMLGGGATESIVITNNSINPTKSLVKLTTEGKMENDELNTIQVNNLPDGSVIFLTVESDKQTVNVKNNYGGTGSIILFQDKDIKLTSDFAILLIREGTVWHQINTSGYIFGQDDLINENLIPQATNKRFGINRIATDAEVSNGTSEIFTINPKQLSNVKNELLQHIYPATVYQNISTTTNTIRLKENNTIYTYSLSGDVTFIFDISKISVKDSSKAITFEMHLYVDRARTIHFPNNVVWLYEESPDLSIVGNHILVFRSYNGGGKWVGSYGGYYK